EVDDSVFTSVVLPFCENKHFSNFYAKGLGLVSHGCCILYKLETFLLIDKSIVTFDADHMTNRARKSVALIAVLKVKKHAEKEKLIICCTTHLTFGQRDENIRIKQIFYIIERLRNVSTLYNDPLIIFSGDFNSKPDDFITNYLLGRTEDLNIPGDSRNCTDLLFKSAYDLNCYHQNISPPLLIKKALMWIIYFMGVVSLIPPALIFGNKSNGKGRMKEIFIDSTHLSNKYSDYNKNKVPRNEEKVTTVRKQVVLMLVGEEKSFGFSYMFNSETRHPMISSINKDSAAERSSLELKVNIILINGKTTYNLSPKSISALIHAGLKRRILKMVTVPPDIISMDGFHLLNVSSLIFCEIILELRNSSTLAHFNDLKSFVNSSARNLRSSFKQFMSWRVKK
ncbi:hypothetical protein HZS_3206, partial [Henneguya salminicola]